MDATQDKLYRAMKDFIARVPRRKGERMDKTTALFDLVLPAGNFYTGLFMIAMECPGEDCMDPADGLGCFELVNEAERKIQVRCRTCQGIVHSVENGDGEARERAYVRLCALVEMSALSGFKNV
jgi:hypothetical protein